MAFQTFIKDVTWVNWLHRLCWIQRSLRMSIFWVSNFLNQVLMTISWYSIFIYFIMGIILLNIHKILTFTHFLVSFLYLLIILRKMKIVTFYYCFLFLPCFYLYCVTNAVKKIKQGLKRKKKYVLQNKSKYRININAT